MKYYALIPMLLLTACSGGRFDDTQSRKVVMPPVIQYDSDQRRKAADEIRGGQCPMLTEFAKDYKWTRDKIRVVE